MVNSMSKLTQLCTKSHNSWVREHRSRRGSDTSRIKSKNGQFFDINLDWDYLNPLWQEESYKTHKSYISKVLPHINTKSNLEDVSDLVHQVWMEENQKHKDESWCNHLFCDYNDLAESDKQMDRNLATLLMEL